MKVSHAWLQLACGLFGASTIRLIHKRLDLSAVAAPMTDVTIQVWVTAIAIVFKAQTCPCAQNQSD
jgi:hypothetical protein